MAKVVIEKLVKIYPDRHGAGVRAVKGIDLVIADGEFMVLVGPSGCGKSTTLRMIAGLEDVSDGTISIDGRVVNDVPPKDRDIAMVFQNYALYPHMTVYENMAFGLKLRKIPRLEIQARVHEAAGLLGLGELLERLPKALSGGQRQRVAVGRAIVRKPKVFLFDEPLSNLDAKMRVQMRAEISRLHKRLGVTLIYVTHDQVEAMTMGDKIVVMKDGKIQQIGSPLYLYNQPINKFVAGFLGTPPMNFLTVKVSEEGGRIMIDEGSFKLMPAAEHQPLLKAYVGKEVTFGIRPEDLEAAPAMVAGTTLRAKVTVVEPLGADINLYATTAKSTMTARVPPHHIFKMGDEVTLAPVMSKARYFDKDTELSILPVKWDEQSK